jgi:hypothetical protein
VDGLENPAVRWAIAFIFLGVELLVFVVVADLLWVEQLLMIIATVFLFAIIPSILKTLSEQGSAPVESTQRQRAAWTASAVDKVAAVMRVDKTAPVISWIAAAFLAILAGETVTDSVSGLPVRMISSTAVYLLLAACAAPPVRSHLQKKLQLGFSRSVVVIVLSTGVVVNEAMLAPPVESSAVVVPFLSL